jgi:hypothetical protein
MSPVFLMSDSMTNFVIHRFVDFMVSMTTTALRFVDRVKIALYNRSDVFSDMELFDYSIVALAEVDYFKSTSKYPAVLFELAYDVVDDIHNTDELRDYISESSRPHRVYMSLIAKHRYRRKFGLIRER